MRLHTTPVCLALAVTSALFAAGTPARADEVFKPTSFVTGFGAQSLASFDISYVDPRHSVYLLADRTNAAIDVVSTKTNKLIKQLTPGFVGFSGNNDTSGPNGVLVAEGNDIWVGDGNSKIWVIDLQSGHVDASFSTTNVADANRADELCWDPDDHIILMANDADKPPFVTFWDSRQSHHFQKLGQITFDGSNAKKPLATNGIEQCQYDPRSHKFLLNLPEINGPGDDTAPGAVAVIDPHHLTQPERIFVLDHNKCAGPQGMAIGPEGQVLIGCNAPSGVTATNPNGNGNFSSVIIDDDADRIVATINNESGPDEVWFNPGDGHYFLARSGAVPPVTSPAVPTQLLGVIDSKRARADQSVYTANKPNPPASSSHSVAADPVRNQVYVPIGHNSSTVCESVGGSNALGCIAVYTTQNDDVAMNHDHDHDHN
jgi:hypothetical protein